MAKKKTKKRKSSPKYRALTQPDWNQLKGVSGQGMVRATYHRLVKAFGRPTHSTSLDDWGEKTLYEWQIVFGDGTVAYLYDSKTSPLYEPEAFGLGEDVARVPRKVLEKWRKKTQEWDIGGRDKRAVRLVKEALGQVKKRELKKIECLGPATLRSMPGAKKRTNGSSAKASPSKNRKGAVRQFFDSLFGT